MRSGWRSVARSRKKKRPDEEMDRLSTAIFDGENAKDKAERERNRLEELRLRQEDGEAKRKDNRMMMMMGILGQHQNRSGSVPNYLGSPLRMTILRRNLMVNHMQYSVLFTVRSDGKVSLKIAT